MKLPEKSEEILETLWLEIVENKKNPDISIFRDDSSIKELKENGYISRENPVSLTSKGIEEGRSCVRRHRLAERLLRDVLQVKSADIHEAGCRLEHILNRGLEDNICTLLGHPTTCPHGRAIPQGKCCTDKKRKPESLVLPLSQLKKGQKGKIAYIQTTNEEMLKRIMAIGALPGLSISLLHRFPSFVFKIGESQFAVDKELAEKIYIWKR